MYTLTIASVDPQFIVANKPIHFTKSVTKCHRALLLRSATHTVAPRRAPHRNCVVAFSVLCVEDMQRKRRCLIPASSRRKTTRGCCSSCPLGSHAERPVTSVDNIKLLSLPHLTAIDSSVVELRESFESWWCIKQSSSTSSSKVPSGSYSRRVSQNTRLLAINELLYHGL
ncbi:uncharacterized protein LOC100303814 [Zea mays]|uniref:Uncharacterized protein n=1 Tax=Zea mays TaxID=4577 RepID=B4FXH9_MAIZE|nr:uncharacterized protein LOC100303814 [Zea mays]ACF86822.2 unknown [Zea mays]|eukprot:NP_001158916.1 uncharacterized protein LOC100303814 [Zea mays]